MIGPGTFPPDVDVAIVAHNNLDVLPGTLASLADAACPADRITVVDVASTDGTADWLAREWPRVRVRRLDRNDGPSPGRNVGIREATRRFVMLLDADVRVQPDTIQLLHRAMIDAPADQGRQPDRRAPGSSRRDSVRGRRAPLHLRSHQPVARPPAGRTRAGAARHRRRADLRPAARPAGGHRRRAVRRALLHRQGGWRLHAPDLSRRLPDSRAARGARPASQPAARHLAVLLSDPQPLAFHAEELPVADAHLDSARAGRSRTAAARRAPSSGPRRRLLEVGRRAAGAFCRACRATAR